MKILVLNSGSSSMKFKLYSMDVADAHLLAEGNCQKIGLPMSEIKYELAGNGKHLFSLELPDHAAALEKTLELLTGGSTKALDSIRELDVIGHRASVGGTKYDSAAMDSDEVLADMERLLCVAPLHTPVQVATIRACRKLLGDDFPMTVSFDTSFAVTIPPQSYLYGIPYEFFERHGIRRHGFHGLSYQYATERYGELSGRSPGDVKIVCCHLGGGSSVAAISNGRMVDNSFGFGTGEGITCGTRAGTFDYQAIPYLMEQENLSFEAALDILSRKSGLLGISGVTSDEKELEELAAGGHARAQLALEVKAQQVRKHIGAYAFEMGGLDAVIFTGGIGENSDYMRSIICRGLERFGILLDEGLNVKHNRTEYKISTSRSEVDVWIIPTNEELVIARDACRLMQKVRSAVR